MSDEEEIVQLKHTNRERRSSSIYKILAGAGGGGFLTFLTWMITQTTDPIIRDQTRLEAKIDTTKLELLAAIKEVKLENTTQFNRMMQILQDDRTAQWRLDEKQNIEISEIKLLTKQTKQTKQKEN